MSATTKVTLLVIVVLGGLLGVYYTMNSDGKPPAGAGAASEATQPALPPPRTPTKPAPTRAIDTPVGRDVGLNRRSSEGPASTSGATLRPESPSRTTVPLDPAPTHPLEANPSAPVRVPGATDPEKEGGPPNFKPGITVPSSTGPAPASPGPEPSTTAGSPVLPSGMPTGTSSPARPSTTPPGPTGTSSPLSPGISPTSAPKPAPTIASPPAARPVQYTVVEGDNMWIIAEKWFGDGTKWDLISKANPLAEPTSLQVGQILNMPPKDAGRPTAPPAASGSGAAATIYVVASGDTLRRIAKLHYGDANNWHGIYDANKAVIGDDPHELQVGMKLTIPRAGMPPTPR